MTGRWYCVDKEGLAMLCYDRKDAQASVAENDKAWPRNAPHQAVRLGDIDAAKREADRLRRELADMTVERDILRRDNANMRASVHTCGPTCSMAGCVNARLQEQLDECGVEAVRLLGLADDGARYREALAELVRIYVKEGAATTPAVEIGAAWDQARTELGEADHADRMGRPHAAGRVPGTVAVARYKARGIATGS